MVNFAPPPIVISQVTLVFKIFDRGFLSTGPKRRTFCIHPKSEVEREPMN
jgi:hypothetical protein